MLFRGFYCAEIEMVETTSKLPEYSDLRILKSPNLHKSTIVRFFQAGQHSHEIANVGRE